MTSNQYQQFEKYMDILSHVWNTTPDIDTSITPFQLEHGMKARSIPDSLIDTQPTTVKSGTKEDLTAIATSANAFRKTLIQVKAFEKTRTAIVLNEKGVAGVRFPSRGCSKFSIV